MLFSRRNFLVLGCSALLIACSEQEALVDKEVSNSIEIVDVQVDARSLPLNGSYVRTGRETNLLPGKVAKDVDDAVTRAVQARHLNCTTEAILNIALTKVALVSPGQAWAVGGKSHISGVVTLLSRSGKKLSEPQTVKGHSDEFRMAGLIGAITSPTSDKDYDQTVAGFSNNAVRKMFKTVTVGMDGSIVN